MKISWVEKYRPKDLDNFICSPEIKEKFKSYIDNKEIPHLLLHSSSPGTGKTSIAKIFVRHIPCDYLYINASEERGIDTLKGKIHDFAYYAGQHDLKICICDEFDFTTPQFQAALRNILESTHEHTRFILTCNYPQKIIEPIRSRCQVYEFKSFTKDKIIERLKKVLEAENIVYDEDSVNEIAKSTYPDIRSAINTSERCTRNGKLVLDKTSFVESVNVKIFDLVQQKKWRDIRKLCLEEGVNYEELYTFIFNEFAENRQKLPDNKVAKILLIIAEKMKDNAFVASSEINFSSCILSIIDIL